MSVITKVLKQKAVYWDYSSLNEYGQQVFSSGIEISVRWDDEISEIIKSDGTKAISRAQVMVDRNLNTGGFLWFGKLTDCADIINPKNNSGAYEIIGFEKTPNFKCTETLRIAYL